MRATPAGRRGLSNNNIHAHLATDDHYLLFNDDEFLRQIVFPKVLVHWSPSLFPTWSLWQSPKHLVDHYWAFLTVSAVVFEFNLQGRASELRSDDITICIIDGLAHPRNSHLFLYTPALTWL